MSNAARFEIPTTGDDRRVYAYDEAGDAHVLVDVGLRLVSALPPATSALRGQTLLLETTDEPDRPYVCIRLGDGTFEWRAT